MRAIDRAMEGEVFQMLARDVAPRAEISAIARVHPLDYIEAIRAATPTQGHTAIDDETSISPGSFEAALRSAGGVIFAVDEVMTRKVRYAFVATRPPGHHVQVATPKGFLPQSAARFMTKRFDTPADRRARLCLSRLLLDFEFGFRSEPEFEASIIRPARLLPQLIGPLADHLFAGAHALIPPSGRAPNADRRDRSAP